MLLKYLAVWVFINMIITMTIGMVCDGDAFSVASLWGTRNFFGKILMVILFIVLLPSVLLVLFLYLLKIIWEFGEY